MLSDCHNILDLREKAKRRLPRGAWEYAERGCEDERSMERNRAALDSVTFRPRVLRPVHQVDTRCMLLGAESAFPLALAPTGAAGLLWYEGDLALARAAAKAGIPFTISSASTMDIEDIAAAGGRLWFQLYLWEDRELSMAVIDRARLAGCDTLFVTVDLPVGANREYMNRNGFGIPFKLNARNTFDAVTHPRWLASTIGRYLLSGGIPSQANLPDRLRARISRGAPPGAMFKQDDLDWDGIKAIRDRWPGKLVLKGVLHPEDATLALGIGADGVVVSNHGGRAFDCSAAPIRALPEVVAAAGGRMAVLMDSGIRRGSDIAKALALGADGVLAGRAPLYGLAVGGEDGVTRAIDLLRTEFARSMGMLGARTTREIGPELLG